MKLKHGGGVAIDGQDVQLPLLQGESCFLLQAGLAQLPQHLPLSRAHCFPFCRNVGECCLWRAGWVSLACIPVRMEGFLEEEDKWRKMAGCWRRGGCSRPGRESRGKAGPRGFSTQLEPRGQLRVGFHVSGSTLRWKRIKACHREVGGMAGDE